MPNWSNDAIMTEMTMIGDMDIVPPMKIKFLKLTPFSEMELFPPSTRTKRWFRAWDYYRPAEEGDYND